MYGKILKVIVLILLPMEIFAQSAVDMLKPDLSKKIGICSVCGMEVFEKMMTRVEILVDTAVYHACGIGCATVIIDEHNTDIKDIKVIDFKTFKLVNARKVLFVIGSVITPVRAMLPEFSFSKKKDAEDFVKIYGGRILNYEEMTKLAREIRKAKKQ
jgi:nitrous oxide reductase accessory protein NosL